MAHIRTKLLLNNKGVIDLFSSLKSIKKYVYYFGTEVMLPLDNFGALYIPSYIIYFLFFKRLFLETPFFLAYKSFNCFL